MRMGPSLQSNSFNQVYVGGSIFVWGTVTINLLGKSKHIWYPYLAAWIIGTLLETCVFLVKGLSGPGKFYLELGAILQICRIACLSVLAGSVLCFSVRRKLSQLRADEEHRPLLGSHGRTHEDYSSVDSADEDDDSLTAQDEDECSDQTKELKEKHKKRLQESGSWMAYLKDFKLLAKLALPSEDRSAKICLAILVVVILADRALNLLVPRQLGIITDKLSSVHETGKKTYGRSKI